MSATVDRAFVAERGALIVDLAADMLVDALIEAAPRGTPNPGEARVGPRLVDTIARDPVEQGGQVIGVRVHADAPQAAYTEYGTAPHLIRPVRAKVLAFWSEAEGQVVFRREVHHPGTTAQPWFFPTGIRMWPQLCRQVAESLPSTT